MILEDNLHTHMKSLRNSKYVGTHENFFLTKNKNKNPPLNPAIYKNDYTSWPRRTYARDAKLAYLEINLGGAWVA